MNKKIISEVSRISTLMGVKPLITEQAVPKFIKSLLSLGDDVVKKFYKTGDNVSDDLLRKVRNGESLSDEAIELLLRNINFKKLSKILIKRKLLGSNFDNIVDSVVDMINKKPENTEDILNRFDTVIDRIPFLNDAPEELIVALKREIRERIISRTSNISNIADTVLDPDNATENIGNGPGINSDDVIENVEQLSKKPGTINQIIQSLVKSFNLQDLQTVLRAWRRAFKKMDTLQAEFNVYAERMEQNIKSGLRYDAEFKKMQDILIAVKKTWGELPKVTYDQWVSQLPPSVQKAIKKGETGKEWTTFYQELLKKEEWVTPLFNETAAFKKLWPFRMPGSETKGWLIFKKPTADLGKRLRNLVIFKDPRTFEEMKNSLIINGVQQDIARTIVSKVVTETVLGPLFLATMGQFVRPISAAGEGLYNSLTDSDENWIDYNERDASGERSSNVFEIIKNDWIQVVKSLMPADVWEGILRIIDPTYIDEFINNVISPLITSEKTIEDSDIREKVKSFKDRKSAEYMQWYNQQTDEVKKVIDEYTKRFNGEVAEAVNTIEDTELGFKAFIIKTWKTKYKLSDKFGKTGNFYTINDGNETFYYVYNNQTKTFDDMTSFNNFIKTKWETDYKDTDKFTKEGDIYVVEVKDVGKFKYKYNGTTFTFIE
jgi:hypothetical protein